MPDKARTLLWVLSTPLLLALLLPQGRALSQEIERVLVTNFPELQKVEGRVSVEGTVRHGSARHFTEDTVTPAKPTETRRLTPGGTLDTDGFTSMVLGLGGQFKTAFPPSGTIGAILLPDEEAIVRAFNEEGKLEFAQEIKTLVTPGPARTFASDPAKLTIGFPRYRIYYYNTTERPVGVDLYVYLTN